jgi:hypothetical protein
MVNATTVEVEEHGVPSANLAVSPFGAAANFLRNYIINLQYEMVL